MNRLLVLAFFGLLYHHDKVVSKICKLEQEVKALNGTIDELRVKLHTNQRQLRHG